MLWRQTRTVAIAAYGGYSRLRAGFGGTLDEIKSVAALPPRDAWSAIRTRSK
jgi:hypothetical protein